MALKHALQSQQRRCKMYFNKRQRHYKQPYFPGVTSGEGFTTGEVSVFVGVAVPAPGVPVGVPCKPGTFCTTMVILLASVGNVFPLDMLILATLLTPC